MDLNGNWEGIISLGKEYGEYAGEEISFRTKLKQEGILITGLSYDVSGFGISPDPADIIGGINGRQINFTKQYSTHHTLVDGKVLVNRKNKGPKIDFWGSFESSDERFNGEWVMGSIRKFLWVFPIQTKATGTWSMQRI